MKTDKIIDIVILLVVLFAGYKAAKMFGLIEDTEGARAEAGFSGNSNFLPYKIIYSTVSLQQLIEGLKPSKQVVLLTQFAVKNYEGLITQLLGAKKLINDDETAVYSVFRSIGSLEELAYFVEQWEKYIDENPVEIRAYYLEDPDEIMNMGVYLASFLNKRDYISLKATLKPLKPFFQEYE